MRALIFLIFFFLDENHKVASVLLRYRAEVNAQDKKGWTALHYAIYKGKLIMISKQHQWFFQQNHHFSSTGYEKTVSLLCIYGANKSLQTKDGIDASKMAKLMNDNSPNRQSIVELLRVC